MIKKMFMVVMVVLMYTTSAYSVTTIMDWGFDASEGWLNGDLNKEASRAQLEARGWVTNGIANSVWVQTGVEGGILTLDDELEDSTPQASYAFGNGYVSGSMTFHYGLTGWAQLGRVALRDGETELAMFSLIDYGSELYYGDTAVSFGNLYSPSAGQTQTAFNNVLSGCTLSWAVNADGTNGKLSASYHFYNDPSQTLVVDVPFIGNAVGIPDNINLSVGWDGGYNRLMHIADMEIVGEAVPEPTTLILLGMGGLVTLYRKRKA